MDMRVESVGYAASLLVAVSLTMSNVWRLRWINLVGALLFTTYGLLLGAKPVWIVNAFIACVNVYFLIQLSTQRDLFGYADVTGPNVRLVEKFLDHYRDDIAIYFPGFDASRLAQQRIYLILRNVMPVGIFIFEPRNDGDMEVLLDYVIPDYRDLRNAEYMFSAQEHLAREGHKAWIAKSTVPAHTGYLLKLGFRLVEGTRDTYRKSI